MKMCTTCKWQGAKNDKFPTKPKLKNNESYFSCDRHFVSPEVLQNDSGHPGDWSFGK